MCDIENSSLVHCLVLFLYQDMPLASFGMLGSYLPCGNAIKFNPVADICWVSYCILDTLLTNLQNIWKRQLHDTVSCVSFPWTCITFRSPLTDTYALKITGLISGSAVPNLFGTRDRFRGRQFFHGRWAGEDGSGGNASDGEKWGAADEASLARLPLTSCCAARYLTGYRLVLVRGLQVGDPWV